MGDPAALSNFEPQVVQKASTMHEIAGRRESNQQESIAAGEELDEQSVTVRSEDPAPALSQMETIIDDGFPPPPTEFVVDPAGLEDVSSHVIPEEVDTVEA